MKDRQLKTYLREGFTRGEEARPEKIAETVTYCKEVIQQYGDYEEEERTGFWQFLSDVFRFEGLSILGLQAGVLFLNCIFLGTMENVVCYIPVFTPLFALAVMPVLLRGQLFNMGEMEAVTRASGAELILAKLILAGAANLICITLLFCLIVYLRHSAEGVGQVVLYGLVPYLVCMTALLRLIRQRKKESLLVCAVATMSFCLVLGVSANALPQLYETSATGLWLILFVIFAGFFGREIGFIVKKKREGKLYGIIS